jgi:glutamate N-acetyltransferase / amino-acid N-acetyltransferase
MKSWDLEQVNIPRGYRYAALYAGIRKAKKDDLALIVSDTPAATAAVFTQNKAMAAPVVLARKNLDAAKGLSSAILINAGNANCATRTCARVALETVRAAAKALKVPATQVLPASTGVIGVELDASLITSKIPDLVAKLSPDNFEQVSRAIMTTDLVPKVTTATLSVRGGEIRIAGMTKGSGMIQPLMATTLGFVMTDAVIPPALLYPMLKRAAARSYNSMSVDGDTSTNDTLTLMANGASGLAPAGRDRALFEEALGKVMEDLAMQIARDGEGAKKLVTIDVEGARSDKDAVRIARFIANSPLVKTAIAGSDPNWGRIIMAAGNAGVDFDLSKVDIHFQSVLVCKNGLAAEFNENELKKLLDAPDCFIRFKIRGDGKGSARFYTCDLTHGYIDINASYRT